MTSAGQKIALVTGANKGLGFETARLLGQAGIHVILTARDEKRGKDAMEKLTKENNKPLFDFVQLDVNEEQSIKSASEHVTKNYGKLDILINNAGIFDIQHDTHPEKVPIASVEKQFKTNFFGTLLVIRYFLPLLRKSDASNGARIINLGTALSSLQFNGDPTSIYYPYRVLGYNASKLALNLLTVQFAEQFKLDKDNIIINSVAPGFAKTDLVPGGGFITAEEGAKVVVERALTNDTDSGKHFTADKEIVPW